MGIYMYAYRTQLTFKKKQKVWPEVIFTIIINNSQVMHHVNCTCMAWGILLISLIACIKKIPQAMYPFLDTPTHVPFFLALVT